MAVWQVEFAIVPRRVLAGSPSSAPSKPTDAAWGSVKGLPADYRRHLAAVAAPGQSSSGDVQTWGVEDGNRVDVWSVDGRATSVTARVDVRRLDSKFGAMLLQFARLADAVLVRSDGLVVAPQVGAFAAALRSSEAWRFANDPTEFLAEYLDDDPSAG